jgi:hypothetical protein
MAGGPGAIGGIPAAICGCWGGYGACAGGCAALAGNGVRVLYVRWRAYCFIASLMR